MHTRVIGMGNPDCGDDVAGLLVARELAGRGWDAVEFTGEALSLIDQWSGCDHVILVDATVSGARVGMIRIWNAQRERLPRESFRCSTHVFGVPEAVELARIFDRMPERLTICGIEGRSFEAGSAPSPAVLAAAHEAALRIVRENGN